MGVDYSHTFVEICRANAKAAGVAAEFLQGDAARLPLANDVFDFLVCRAAFKNFGDPVGALNEMHRVLRPGGEAVIVDLRKDANDREIAEEVATMKLGWLDAMLTRGVLRSLRARAYTREDFERMIADTLFGEADITGRRHRLRNHAQQARRIEKPTLRWRKQRTSHRKSRRRHLYETYTLHRQALNWVIRFSKYIVSADYSRMCHYKCLFQSR